MTVRVSPSTLIVLAGNGLGAGGFTTEPSVIEYLLPWQSQLIVSVTVATVQPWWVHTALNALNSPAFGWVITACASGKILPLPTGYVRFHDGEWSGGTARATGGGGRWLARRGGRIVGAGTEAGEGGGR